MDINQLRIFFRMSNAAFDFSTKVNEATGGSGAGSEMQELHMVALIEVEKEEPDMVVLNNLLAQMEKLAERQAIAKAEELRRKFKPGGWYHFN